MARVSGVSPDTILDVAEDVFSAGGLKNTSLQDVARAAGISKGTLYYHFASKESLVYGIAARYFDAMSSRLLRWVESAGAHENSEDALRSVLENVLEDGNRAKIKLYLLQDAVSGNAALREKFIIRYEEWKKTLAGAIAGRFEKDESQSSLSSELLLSVLDGCSLRWVLTGHPPDCGRLARALSLVLA